MDRPKNKKEIIKEIKLLKKVEPDSTFVKHTRNLVLTAKPHLRLFPAWVMAAGLAAITLALIGSGFLFSNQEPSISSSLEKESLVNEFNELDANLQIDEMAYSQDVHKTIASALTEISSSKTSHLNPSILESEQEYINELEKAGKREEEINNLLNKL